MKFEKMPAAEPRPDDKPEMIRAIERLDSFGLHIRRPQNNNYQIKVTEHISYYPSKQTIYVDGEDTVRQQRGVKALVDLLVEWQFLDPKIVALPMESIVIQNPT